MRYGATPWTKKLYYATDEPGDHVGDITGCFIVDANGIEMFGLDFFDFSDEDSNLANFIIETANTKGFKGTEVVS